MARLVTIVVINSLSYTGTTWLNAVLGSHPRSFALGPPKRVYEKRGSGWDDACLVHGAACPFWPVFHRNYDPRRNFFLQLAEASGRDVIIINNPTADVTASEMRHPDILVKPVNLIRDGRAIAASYARHSGKPFFEAVTQFLQPSFHAFYFDPANTDTLCLRYEDVNRDRRKVLGALAAFVAIDYSRSALQFWRHDHHLTSGNHALVALIKMGQGASVSHLKERDFYEAEFRRMQQGEDAPFEDNRWTEELTALDRFVFDLFCGLDNARFGYERDRFTLAEMAAFWSELRDAAASGDIPRRLLARAQAQLSNRPGSVVLRLLSSAGERGRASALRIMRRAIPGVVKRAARRLAARLNAD